MNRILVVDDSEFLRDTLRQTLEREGYMVDTVPDGHEALLAFRKQPYDLVITDIYMPNMDGIALLNSLKSINPKLKVICMSGGNPAFRAADLNLAKQMGANYVVNKPFDKMDIINNVWKLLN